MSKRGRVENDWEVGFCEKCGDGYVLELFSAEKPGVCVYCEEVGVKCRTCAFRGPVAAFINEKGRITGTCPKCRVYYRAATQRHHNKKMSEATNGIASTCLKVCTVCTTAKDPSEFKDNIDGSTTKMCVSCREKRKKQGQNGRKKALESDSKRVRFLLREKQRRYREKNKNSEAWKKHQRDVKKEWSKKNPEKLKARNKRRLYKTGTMIGKYKGRAKEAGLEYSLTTENAISLFDSPCVYCGLMDPRGRCGIDRVDNLKGYTIVNCVSCCKMCNLMKRSWTRETFIAYAGHIAAIAGIGGKTCYERLIASKRAPFNDYVRDSAKRGYAFNLERNDFDNIVALPCYLCGHENSSVHSNGIDRVDNTIGYEKDNCKSCCATCNKMKYTFDLQVFLRKCNEIFQCCSNSTDFGEGAFINAVRKK